MLVTHDRGQTSCRLRVFYRDISGRPTDGRRAANGFATSRAHSMKSLVTGLRVRFFRVMIPTGQGGLGKSTGKGLSGGKFVPSCNNDPDIARRNGPPARSAKSK